jgi:hypothetical protein
LALAKNEREFHRKTAVACFNRTWDYLDMKHRDSKDEEEMLHLAHTSRYHWGIVGAPRQLAVGDWQLGRVYAALGEAELSLQYSLSSLRTCERQNLTDLIPSAMEGVARAYAAAGDGRNATKLLKMAREKLDKLSLDAEDRKIFQSQIRDTERLASRSRI